MCIRAKICAKDPKSCLCFTFITRAKALPAQGKWPRSRSCFYCLFKLRFQRLVDGADGGGIGFDGRAVVGEQPFTSSSTSVSWVYTSAERPFSAGEHRLALQIAVALSQLCRLWPCRSRRSSGRLIAGHGPCNAAVLAEGHRAHVRADAERIEVVVDGMHISPARSNQPLASSTGRDGRGAEGLSGFPASNCPHPR